MIDHPVPDVLAGAAERDDTVAARRARAALYRSRVDWSDPPPGWVRGPEHQRSPVWLVSSSFRTDLQETMVRAFQNAPRPRPLAQVGARAELVVARGELLVMWPSATIQARFDDLRDVSFSTALGAAEVSLVVGGLELRLSFRPPVHDAWDDWQARRVGRAWREVFDLTPEVYCR